MKTTTKLAFGGHVAFMYDEHGLFAVAPNSDESSAKVKIRRFAGGSFSEPCYLHALGKNMRLQSGSESAFQHQMTMLMLDRPYRKRAKGITPEAADHSDKNHARHATNYALKALFNEIPESKRRLMYRFPAGMTRKELYRVIADKNDRVWDVVQQFPYLMYMIASQSHPSIEHCYGSEGTFVQARQALKMAEQGSKLKHIAGVMGVDMAMRKLPPAMMRRSVLSTLEFLNRNPKAVHDCLPQTVPRIAAWAKAIDRTLDQFDWDEDGLNDYVLWIAKNAFNLTPDNHWRYAYTETQNITDWVTYGFRTNERDFNPKMSSATALRRSAQWHEKVANGEIDNDFCHFPEPWFEGDLLENGMTIKPVIDSTMLEKEGFAFHNCASSYRVRMLDGITCIYVIYSSKGKPVSMVSLRRDRSGNAVIGQERGPCNKAPTKDVSAQTNKWLARMNRKVNTPALKNAA